MHFGEMPMLFGEPPPQIETPLLKLPQTEKPLLKLLEYEQQSAVNAIPLRVPQHVPTRLSLIKTLDFGSLPQHVPPNTQLTMTDPCTSPRPLTCPPTPTSTPTSATQQL